MRKFSNVADADNILTAASSQDCLSNDASRHFGRPISDAEVFTNALFIKVYQNSVYFYFICCNILLVFRVMNFSSPTR